MAESEAETIALLERFVVDNNELLMLESKIGRFNIFDALGITRHEIRHSNFLAFLLDPAESHGQGQLFLKSLLMDLLKNASPELRPFSPIELDGSDLRGVEIRREWQHIDLLITCEQPAFVVVIENKVDSVEHSDQLARYAKTMTERYATARPLYVFLTLNADKPSDDLWMRYSYADIYRVFARVRDTYQKAIGDDVLVFLDQYLALIGSYFMNDKEIDDLCKRIYKNHRQAIDLIMNRAGSPAAGALAEALAVLEADPNKWKIFYKSAACIDFTPASWLEWLPPLGLHYKDEPRAWFIFSLERSQNGIDYVVRICRMKDQGQRRKIIELLMAEGEQFGFTQKGPRQIGDASTQLSAREKVLVFAEDAEPDRTTIQTAIKKKLEEIYTTVDSVPTAIKGLLGL